MTTESDTENNTAAISAALFLAAAELDWTPDRKAPDDVCHESLRHRGIDRLTIRFGSDKKRNGIFSKLFSFGKKQPDPTFNTTISIAEDKLCLEQGNRESTIALSDIRAIEVTEPARKKDASLRIETCRAMVRCGKGMRAEALQWIRDQLILETAGLTWHPIFNVGRRTTIKTVSADFDTYKQWPKGDHALLQFFFEQAPKKAAGLVAAIGEKDPEVACSNAAWLKSSCAVVGAKYLSGLCQRIEVHADNNEFKDIRVLIENFQTEFNSVLEHLCEISGKTVSEAGLLQELKYDFSIESAPNAARILLVEDSIVNQEIACAYLSEAGHHTTIASDGNEALEILENESFDLILMDCQMPGLDGIEATKKIRAIQNWRMSGRTPIVALTANALKDDKKRCIDAKMDDYLAKPYAPNELIDIVNRWIAPRDEAAPQDQVDDAQVDDTDVDEIREAV